MGECIEGWDVFFVEIDVGVFVDGVGSECGGGKD